MLIALYILAAALLLLLIGNLFTTVLQDYFIYRPIKLKSDFIYAFESTFEELMFKTDNGGTVNALWFRQKNRPVIFYCHGNSSNLSRWGHLHRYFDELGYDLFIWDYRGFGKSKGVRTEENFHKDAKVLYDFIASHYSARQIVVFGRSMGCGIASKLAAENPCRLLILETPFYSIRNLFKTYYPFLPTTLFTFKYKFKNQESLPFVECPVHVFHGTKDVVIPLRCAARLKPLLEDPSRFYIIQDGKHKNLGDFQEYQEIMVRILT